MKDIILGEFNSEQKTVSVTFKITDTQEHTRDINAVITNGEYDSDGTMQRATEVGRGILHKIDAGVISPVEAQPAEVKPEQKKTKKKSQ